MIKIYCDNGACPKELKDLQVAGIVELIMFKYENTNRHIKNSGIPSSATHNDMKNYTYENAPGRYSDYTESDKYQDIVSIVGRSNRVDILHLDSAYKTGVDVFITNDKDDIISYRDELEKKLGIRFFYTDEIDDLVSFITATK